MFVRNDHAEKMNFDCQKKRLRVTMLGGQVQEIDGKIYHCKIKDKWGNIHEFNAHGLNEVTGNLGDPLSKELMRQLFPNVMGCHKLTGAMSVDYLIGLGKASWQPQRVQKALMGGDFWIWENRFGTCVGGSHPMVTSFTSRSDNLYTVLKVITEEVSDLEQLRIPTCSAFLAKNAPADSSDFFAREQLATVVEPKCGSCRCGKCPIPGSRYSFREEMELKMIDENLSYDVEKGCWTAAYLYLFPREVLKGSQ